MAVVSLLLQRYNVAFVTFSLCKGGSNLLRKDGERIGGTVVGRMVTFRGDYVWPN